MTRLKRIIGLRQKHVSHLHWAPLRVKGQMDGGAERFFNLTSWKMSQIISEKI